ncbi:MAG: energy-coupling factor transporter ATPase [Clostridia bacterium]|nr:energy-coupling factor transporter ATPase [Clostridia bacterium]
MKKSDTAVIEYDHVRQSYNEGTEVIRDLSLRIYEGEFVALLGANGCGKSTLAKLTNAILTPSSGKVTVYGMDTADPDRLMDIRRCVGMVFQNPDNQIVATTVEEDTAFALENLGVPPAEMRRRVDRALEEVGMSEFAQHPPHKLSGGQKQRVAIAGIIAMQPKCIVLDEPTAMLDPKGRREIISTVRRLNEEGITVILVTHYMDEAAKADRVVVMEAGEILADGTPREIFAQAEFLAAHGLDVPVSTRLVNQLQEDGLPAEGVALDPHEAAHMITSAIRKQTF